MSGMFTAICLVSIIIIVTMLFLSKERSRIAAELGSASNVVIRAYGIGDLVELRSNLNSIAYGNNWYAGEFLNSDGQRVWFYKAKIDIGAEYGLAEQMWNAVSPFSRGVMRRNFIITMKKDLGFADGESIGMLFVSRHVVTQWETFLRQIVYVLIGIVAIWGMYLMSIWIVSRRTLSPMTLLVNDLKAEADKMAISLCKDNKFDELENIRRWFKQIGSSWFHEKRRAVASESMATVGRISSHIAHDMRSPLSVLKGYVGATGQHGDPDLTEYHAAASRSVAKLEAMANDLVDYAGASNLQRSPLVLEKLICDGVIAETRGVANDKGCAVTCTASKELKVNIDGYKLERVLINLVLNGIQAMEGRGGTVRLAGQIEHEKDLRIEVLDNGKGIDPENLPHVFDSFFTKGKRGGTGLGLAYCKQVVEAHGGIIGVASSVEKGTTFTIRIPNCIVATEVRELDMGEMTEKKTNTVDERIACMGKVLIADDDPDIRKRWRDIITERGGQIATVYDSADLLIGDETVDYTHIDTAIVDYDFKGDSHTGIDLIAHLKRKDVKTVYLCTGYANNRDICDRARAAGAVKVLSKPINLVEL